MSFEGQVVLVTGGSEGLGRSVATQVARKGGYVWLVSRDAEKLASAVGAIRDQGGCADYRTCDVRIGEQVHSCVDGILEACGRIDVLVNNAGLWLEGDIGGNEPEAIKQVIDTNLLGPILVARAVLPIMKRQGRGQILNVNSTSGVEPYADWPVYVASKYGLRGFSDSLQRSLDGTGIRVLSIYPGGMGTDLYKNAGLPYSADEPWMMSVEDVAQVVCDILSASPGLAVSHVEIRKA
jgi:NAD(P)-dependent dehydrogenase (short-subunit alcohol dehydrogenase family)